MAYVFVYTQYSVIRGLSCYIRDKIEPTLRYILEAESENVFLGEGGYVPTLPPHVRVLGKAV